MTGTSVASPAAGKSAEGAQVNQEGARRDGADAGAGERARVLFIGWAPSWALRQHETLAYTHAW